MSKILGLICPDAALIVGPTRERGAYRNPRDAREWILVVFFQGDMVELGVTTDIEFAKTFAHEKWSIFPEIYPGNM